MYTDFYNLTGQPFQLTPDPRFYFDSRTHSKAMSYLSYGLSQGEGFIVITGEVGAGKTTIVGSLLNTIDTNHFIAGKVVTTQLEADSFLRMIAEAFQVPQQGLDKATLLKTIENFLIEVHRSGRRAVLIVDEAQNLSNESLEELRMLSNFQLEGTALLQSFLIGQPQFRERLTQDPNLEQVRQRVIANYHLMPMEDASETGDYILHRLGTVGWNGDPNFTADAIQKIHDYTGGIPRRLNTLCSRLMLFGFLEETHKIDAQIVEEVVEELDEAELGATPPVSISARAGGEELEAISDQIEELAARIGLLERYVAAHERAINLALEIVRQQFPEAAQQVQPESALRTDS